MNRPRRVVAALMCAALGAHAAAAVVDATPDDYRARLAGLHAGDELRLAPGDYLDGLPVHGLAGSAERPIVISGPAGPERARFPARTGHNTVSVVDAAHVEIRNLDLDGRDLPVDGVKCEGHARFAHHVTLQGLRILRHGHSQQTVGISSKCPAWGWVIRANLIVGAGTGIYLGNSDGSDPFIAGLIEGNVIADSTGYNLQIKHQQPRPVLEGMPREPAVTVIRNNAFIKVAAQRADALARPSVLVGHWPLAGAGAHDRYLIEGNFFYGNPAPLQALFQGEGNLELRHNLFIAPEGDAIRIQPHNDVPREVLVEGNTVRARDAGIVLQRGPGPDAWHQRVRDNVVTAARPVSVGFREGNVLEVRSD